MIERKVIKITLPDMQLAFGIEEENKKIKPYTKPRMEYITY